MGSDKTLKEIAEEKLASGNASQLGDPISLKAETSDNIPTPEEAGAKNDKQSPKQSSGQSSKNEVDTKDKKHKSLKQVAQETNPSMLGDPISLKAETSNSEPTENDRGALKDKKRSSKI